MELDQRNADLHHAQLVPTTHRGASRQSHGFFKLKNIEPPVFGGVATTGSRRIVLPGIDSPAWSCWCASVRTLASTESNSRSGGSHDVVSLLEADTNSVRAAKLEVVPR